MMGSLTGFDKGLKRFHEDRAGHRGGSKPQGRHWLARISLGAVSLRPLRWTSLTPPTLGPEDALGRRRVNGPGPPDTSLGLAASL